MEKVLEPATHPNKITKEKIWHFKQVKAEQRISLYRMAGQSLTKRSTWKTAPPQYNPRAEGLLEQNDPRPKGAGKIQRKLNKVRFESRPRKRQRPMPEEDEEIDPIIVADLGEDKETDPTIFVSLDEDRQKDQEEEPPQSPRKKRKEICHMHTPQSHLPTPHLKMMTGKPKVSLDWSLQMWTKTL